MLVCEVRSTEYCRAPGEMMRSTEFGCFSYPPPKRGVVILAALTAGKS